METWIPTQANPLSAEPCTVRAQIRASQTSTGCPGCALLSLSMLRLTRSDGYRQPSVVRRCTMSPDDCPGDSMLHQNLWPRASSIGTKSSLRDSTISKHDHEFAGREVVLPVEGGDTLATFATSVGDCRQVFIKEISRKIRSCLPHRRSRSRVSLISILYSLVNLRK